MWLGVSFFMCGWIQLRLDILSSPGGKARFSTVSEAEHSSGELRGGAQQTWSGAVLIGGGDV